MPLNRNDWDKEWSDDVIVYVLENSSPFTVVLRETTNPAAAEMRAALAAAKAGDSQAMENIRDWLWRALRGGHVNDWLPSNKDTAAPSKLEPRLNESPGLLEYFAAMAGGAISMGFFGALIGLVWAGALGQQLTTGLVIGALSGGGLGVFRGLIIASTPTQARREYVAAGARFFLVPLYGLLIVVGLLLWLLRCKTWFSFVGWFWVKPALYSLCVSMVGFATLHPPY